MNQPEGGPGRLDAAELTPRAPQCALGAGLHGGMPSQGISMVNGFALERPDAPPENQQADATHWEHHVFI